MITSLIERVNEKIEGDEVICITCRMKKNYIMSSFCPECISNTDEGLYIEGGGTIILISNEKPFEIFYDTENDCYTVMQENTIYFFDM